MASKHTCFVLPGFIFVDCTRIILNTVWACCILNNHKYFFEPIGAFKFYAAMEYAVKIQPFRSKVDFDVLASVLDMPGGDPGGATQCFNVSYNGPLICLTFCYTFIHTLSHLLVCHFCNLAITLIFKLRPHFHFFFFQGPDQTFKPTFPVASDPANLVFYVDAAKCVHNC